MASPATSEASPDDGRWGAVPYSPLATPSRSSMRPKEGVRRAGSVAASVRFSGVFYQAIHEEHTDGVGPMKGRNPQGIKRSIFKKYFDEFNAYPLMLDPTTPSRGASRAGGSIRSAPATPQGRRGGGGGVRGVGGSSALWDAPWTPISAAGVSTTHVPSEWDTPRPRWAVGRQPGATAAAGGAGDGPMHAATRPVTCGGGLPGHVAALDELLARSWTRKEVEAAQAWGFFRRLLPHLAVAQLQAPAALLLGRCARLSPALLPPLAQEVCGLLPLLMTSARLDTRQAGLCLLGLLWRSTAASSHTRSAILAAPRLLEALSSRAADGDFDALFAIREVAEEGRGALALEAAGALRAVCSSLRRLVPAAEAAAANGGEEGQAGGVAGRTKGVAAGPGATGGKCGADAAGPAAGATRTKLGTVGVTEGGAAAEAAATGILVADCVAAFTCVLPASSSMVKRYRVPERLVALLLTVRVEPEEEEEEGEQGTADKEAGKEEHEGQVDSIPLAILQQSRDGEEKVKKEEVAVKKEDEDSLYGSDFEDEEGEGEKAGGGSGKGSGGGSTTGSAVPGGGAEEADKGKEESARGPRPPSPARRRQLQLQEALLRALHALAACGMGREPQEAVQRALRDAGPPALERLARVLQDRFTLSGCTCAAYLLWLAAAGDFSATPASELNVLRGRMAAQQPAEADKDSSSGGSGGFGVVPAVRELLLGHVRGWRDTDLGDAVAAVRTTVPPPPTPPPPRLALMRGNYGSGSGAEGETGGGGGGGSMGGGSDTSARIQQQQQQQWSAAAGQGGSGAVPPAFSCGVSDPNQGLTISESPAARGGGMSGGSLGLPQLRIGSAGLLLTPRQSRPGSGPIVSPQRYAAGSSDEEEDVHSRRGGGGGDSEFGGGGGADGSGGSRDGGGGGYSDPAAATPPEDMDLSNIIDSSVELTGKENIMRAIQAAASLVTQDGYSGPRVSGGAGAVAPMPSPGDHGGGGGGGGARGGFPGGGGGVDGMGFIAPTATRSSEGNMTYGSGSTPFGAPHGNRSRTAEGQVGDGPGRLNVLRPAALELEVAASPMGRPTAVEEPAATSALVMPSAVARLAALKAIRQRRRALVPQPSELQALMRNCVGLLAAVALSGAGCRAICESGSGAGSGLMSYIAALMEIPGEVADSVAAAAVSGSGLALRLQLLALLANLSLHSEGAAATAAAASPDGGAPLPVSLYGTARLSCDLVRSSPTSWRAGQELLEACFAVMTNLHRARTSLDLPSDSGSGQSQDSYGLAAEVLGMQLPGGMGAADRSRVRSSAARMLDSAICAYEGVGRTASRSMTAELLALLAAGAGLPAATGSSGGSGGDGAGLRGGGAAAGRAFSPGLSASSPGKGGDGGGGGGPRVDEATEKAAVDAAGALWQLLAAGQVHPDAVAAELNPPIAATLRRPDAGAALTRGSLGLVSCICRSPLAARRLWTSPVVPAVMWAHARAKATAEGEVEAAAREVCQQLLRACHREDRGGVSDVDKRVDRWGLTERMLRQLKSRLEWDSGEEAIMLVAWEED